MASTPETLSLFYIYAYEDASLRAALDRHLGTLRQLGWLQSWHDREIPAGVEQEYEIEAHLNNANIILLLISANFISSEYCYSIAMEEALRRYYDGEAVVIPIILRPVDWQNTPFSKLQVLPTGGKPITSWSNEDEAFEQVAHGIRSVVEILRQQIFIISAPPDRSFSDRLKQDLSARGVFIGGSTAQQGRLVPNSQETIYQAMRTASAVLLVVSLEAPYSGILKDYLEIASFLKLRILAIWAYGNDDDTTLPDQWRVEEVIDAREERYETAIREVLRRLRQQRFVLSTPGAPMPSLMPRNPYKGLRAFATRDARDFFGRDNLTQHLLQTLQTVLLEKPQAGQASRLIAVIGPSGSGKSSVVMAGLLPLLHQGAIPGSENWLYPGPVLPGKYPLEALAISLAKTLLARDALSLQRDLEMDSTRVLHVLASQAVEQSDKKLVILIDQFEELFTLTTTEAERQHFIDLLITAATELRGPTVVILTLRADFYDRPMSYAVLSHLIQKHLIQVLPMSMDDLRTAVEKPASLPDVQVTFEPQLVNDLLFDIWGQSGALPLLQFTLEQLFHKRRGHVLTLQSYHEIGGLKGSLSKHAENTYVELPTDEHRKLARMLFMRLINVGVTEQKATRRRAALSEFLLDNVQQSDVFQETIDYFVKARLLTTGYINEIKTIEVSHEALIYAWSRLSEWLNEAYGDVLLQETISRDATAWEHYGKPHERLYRGRQLKDAKAWARRNAPNMQETAFIHRSVIRQRQSMANTATGILLPLLILGLVAQIVTTRPYWCPTWLCRITTKPITTTQGSHDANLDVYFISFQSPTYVIPGDPQKPDYIPDRRNPQSIGAIPLNASTAPIPYYTIAIGLHSLSTGQYAILIDQVRLLVSKVAPVPDPLHVAQIDASTTFSTTHPARFLYQDQQANQTIPDIYADPGRVQLASGESDQIDAAIGAHVPVDMHFRIQVTYHIATQVQTYTLMLPDIFEVVVSATSKWQMYKQNVAQNNFVPAPNPGTDR